MENQEELKQIVGMNEQEQIKEAISLKSPKTLLLEAWSDYKKRVWGFLGIMLSPFFLLVIEFAFIVIMSMISQLVHFDISILFLPFFIIDIIFFFWSQIALINYASTIDGIVNSYKKNWGLLIDCLLLIGLSSLVILGGTFLFIIPGIIISIWFSFILFVLILEKEKGMNALLKSYTYVKGRWFPIFLRILVPVIIAFLASFITSALFGRNNSMTVLVNLFLIPLYYFYIYRLYVSAKETAPNVCDEGNRELFKGLAFFAIAILLLIIVLCLLFISWLFAFFFRLLF